MYKTSFVSAFFFSVLVAVGTNEGQQRSQLKETTDSRYKVGQLWGYWTRPEEKTSSFVVVKVEKHPTLRTIIHISLRGLRIKKPNGDIIETLNHIPFTEYAIDSSGPKLLSEKADLPDYEDGYRRWREAFDAGRGIVYARTIAETLEELEASLYRDKIPDRSEEDFKILSRERPAMFREYNRVTNRTSVAVFLTKSRPVLSSMYDTIPDPDAEPPVQSGILLSEARYDYEGRVPTGGARSAKFTFVTTRKETYKDPPPFTISVEGQPIYEGEAELSLDIYEVNRDKKASQRVTLKVPLEILLRVAAAEKAEFKIGTKSYKPESFQHKYMRSLTKIIAEQGK